MKNKKTILVTGGAGYIGSAIVAEAITRGHTVYAFDDLSTGQRDKVHKDAIFIRGDITNVDDVRDALCSELFDVVIHCAAKKSVAESEARSDFYYYNNIVGMATLLTVMSECEVPHIVFSSTAAVYAPQKNGAPVTEETPLDPQSVYGISKRMGEQLIAEYCRTDKLDQYTIFRYFNVAGDAGLDYCEDKAENVFPLIARSLTSGSPFHIFGTDYDTKDGTGVRDYIHLSDLVDAHVVALDTEESGIYNLGTGTGYSVRELIQTFEEVSGKNIPIQESPRRAGDIALVTTDASKAQKELNWTPKRTLTEMVESTVKVY